MKTECTESTKWDGLDLEMLEDQVRDCIYVPDRPIDMSYSMLKEADAFDALDTLVGLARVGVETLRKKGSASAP